MRKRLLAVVALAAGLIYSVLTDPVGFLENLIGEMPKGVVPNETFETRETSIQPSTESAAEAAD